MATNSIIKQYRSKTGKLECKTGKLIKVRLSLTFQKNCLICFNESPLNMIKNAFYFMRSSHPEVLLGKCVLKICSQFTGEHRCRSAISINLLCNFLEITLRHRCSPVNFLHIFRKPSPKNIPGRLPLFHFKGCFRSQDI